jgi:hypothetical protein
MANLASTILIEEQIAPAIPVEHYFSSKSRLHRGHTGSHLLERVDLRRSQSKKNIIRCGKIRVRTGGERRIIALLSSFLPTSVELSNGIQRNNLNLLRRLFSRCATGISKIHRDSQVIRETPQSFS